MTDETPQENEGPEDDSTMGYDIWRDTDRGINRVANVTVSSWPRLSAIVGQQAAVNRTAKADPSNIQEVAASQLAIINSYYNSGLQQSQQSFRWSLIWGGIGFTFLLIAVGTLLIRQPAEVAITSSIAGAIVELFAATYLYLYKHASDQLAAFRSSLEQTQQLLLANSMCEKLEGETEQQTRAEIIRLMVNSAISIPKASAKRGEQYGPGAY